MNAIVKTENSLGYSVRDAFCPEDYDFTIDWLNVRLDCNSVDELLVRLCLAFPEIDISDWKPRKGVCFFEHGLYLSTLGYSSFVIAYNLDFDGNLITHGNKRGDTYGVLLSISGDGCRFINSLQHNGFNNFLDAIAPFNPQCSRIDTACDIFDRENCLVPMIQTFADYAYDRDNALIDFNCGLQRLYTDKATGEQRYRQWVTFNVVFDQFEQQFTRNVTIGGRDCKKGTLQLYNKRVEVESGRLQDVSSAILASKGDPDYWYRLEYRCKSFSQKVFLTLLETRDILQAFLCAANEMGTFVIAGDANHINLAETCLEWLSFIDFIESQISGDIHFVQLPIVNLPYIGTSLERVRKFHSENITANDTIHFLLLMLDSEYRQRMYNKMCQHLAFNDKLKPALRELQVEYGCKIPDLTNLMWEQSTLF